jgi:N-acylglucosamine-6-phosphate 2-epimerase
MIKKEDFIVSCQALEDEPLHSDFIMGRMAKAAILGGADGIRANGVSSIIEIKNNVDCPIIGIIKKNYSDSNVYITPSIKEVDELVEVGVEVIAVDATNRLRPGNVNLESFFKEIKLKYPQQLFMADCSTFEEMLLADKLGFDYIGTTLFGYTEYSSFSAFIDIDVFNDNVLDIKKPIIAEGQIGTPKLARKIKDKTKVHAIVVGGAITRPQQITKEFEKHLKENNV